MGKEIVDRILCVLAATMVVAAFLGFAPTGHAAAQFAESRAGSANPERQDKQPEQRGAGNDRAASAQGAEQANQDKEDKQDKQDKQGKQGKQDNMKRMPGMDHGQMPGMNMGDSGSNTAPAANFIQLIEHHSSSDTSAQPSSTPLPMLMKKKGDWMLMLHANVFLTEQQQSSPRGGDKLFSTSWFMPMASRTLGPGVLTLRTMLSLDPATISARRYPLLFQQGETAFGRPIIDGQHPHDFFMEIAALYDVKLDENTLLSFYVAPMGDPALGPTAYPHRASASENPVAALGHHQQDSSHIAADVVTLGLTHRIVRIEASGFHGREPDEMRWNIEHGKIDSWSARLTVQPRQNWSAQYSYGRIASPESLFPDENQERMTASVMYNRPLREGNWSSTLLWGRTRSLGDNTIFNSYLFESTARFKVRNYVWTRIENVERSNELLLGPGLLPSGFHEQPAGRVQAYTLGYDRDVKLIPHVASAMGGQFTVYGVDRRLQPLYGRHPFGIAIFLRFRTFSGEVR